MRATILLLLTLATAASAAGGSSPREAERYLGELRKAVAKINDAHARRPGDETEADLAEKLPRALRGGLDSLLAMDEGDDRAEDLARVEKALAKDEAAAARLGHYLSRDRFLLHATGVTPALAEEFARVLEGVLAAYDKTFGFAEFSKVPGKKIRIFLHREAKAPPPHFAPEFPWHSAIDFPVTQDHEFRSPTRDGRFEFYGLCHELGHLIAMWGDRKSDSGPGGDHHAWAHYTGVVILEACAKAPFAKKLRDVRWRSLEADRKKYGDTEPGGGSREAVLALLIALHDLVGPKTIGDALNLMDEKGMGQRVNHVRYYHLDDLGQALGKVVKSKGKRRAVAKLFE